METEALTLFQFAEQVGGSDIFADLDFGPGVVSRSLSKLANAAPVALQGMLAGWLFLGPMNDSGNLHLDVYFRLWKYGRELGLKFGSLEEAIYTWQQLTNIENHREHSIFESELAELKEMLKVSS